MRSAHDPGEVRDLTDEILERSDYNPPETLGELIQRKVSDAIDWLFDGLGGPGSVGGGALGWLAWLVLVVMIAGVVGFVVWSLTSGRLGTSVRRRRVRNDEGVVAETAQERSSALWLGDAEEHEAAGRWREGILCRYRAVVVELAARKIVSEVAGRTSGELKREVTAALSPARAEDLPAVGTERPSAPAPSLAPMAEAFSEATDLFEEVWYGGVESGPADRDRFDELAQRVLPAPSEPARRQVPPVEATV